MAGSKPPRTKVFISYSHEDRRALKDLSVHLVMLERNQRIDYWDDTKITPGQDWRLAIEQALDEAKVAILMISATFLASDFITKYELPPLLAAEKEDGLLVIPVILSPCLFEESELSKFKAINDPDKTLDSMTRVRRTKVWVRLAKHILSVLDEEKPAPQPGKNDILTLIVEGAANNVRRLDLTDRGVAEVPPEIEQLRRLTTLLLSKNQLTELPQEIAALKQLKTLYLARNAFTTLPSVLTHLPKLKNLYFSLNKLESIPSSIRQLGRLELLDLSKNKLTSIPSEIGRLSKLEKLNLAGNSLASIPSELGHLRNLKLLNLSGNKLSEIPREIHRLDTLELLDLRRNPLPIDPQLLDNVSEPRRILDAVRDRGYGSVRRAL